MTCEGRNRSARYWTPARRRTLWLLGVVSGGRAVGPRAAAFRTTRPPEPSGVNLPVTEQVGYHSVLDQADEHSAGHPGLAAV